jgi:hypothetical protein
MNILAFFTDGGIPREGLRPTVKVVEVDSTAVIIPWLEMDEVSDGWYKYNFESYDYQKEYIVIFDGGEELDTSERFGSSASDNSNHEIAQIVWGSQVSEYQVPGSFGELLKQTSDGLKRALGLLHENIYIDNPMYDKNNNLITARVRIYSEPGSIGTDNNVIGTYLISSDGTDPGKFNNWSQIKL